MIFVFFSVLIYHSSLACENQNKSILLPIEHIPSETLMRFTFCHVLTSRRKKMISKMKCYNLLFSFSLQIEFHNRVIVETFRSPNTLTHKPNKKQFNANSRSDRPRRRQIHWTKIITMGWRIAGSNCTRCHTEFHDEFTVAIASLNQSIRYFCNIIYHTRHVLMRNAFDIASLSLAAEATATAAAVAAHEMLIMIAASTGTSNTDIDRTCRNEK